MEILQKVVTGVSYYPEHWPRQRWEEDINNMADMGLSVVRIGELAWADMERRDGEFTFDWIEEFVNLAGKKGIKTILGTPSEETPVWLRNSHPEMIKVDETGKHTGARGHNCKNNRTFRYYTARITREMVKRFAKNPNVAGWQIDNELHGFECYCDSCSHMFQVWLRKKYQTVDNVNEAWGTMFWSQHFNSFEEIKLPAKKELTVSVSQLMDFKRFVSDNNIDFLAEQTAIIKESAPDHVVSHNSPGLHQHINQYDAAKVLDVLGWDLYPNVDGNYVNENKCHDFFRSATGNNFWVLEQKNGYFNAANYNLAIKPGLVRAWGWADIARGANAVVYYRYRANRYGMEQNPNGIIRHDGSKRRAYYEIQQLNRELAPISDKLGKTHVAADIAIIHSYDDLWACQVKKQYTSFDANQLENNFYSALLSRGVTADLIQPEDDLSAYKIVIAPNLMLLSQKTADNITRFVENGGAAVFHIRCGQKNTANAMVDIPWPGLVRSLCGITVEEFEAYSPETGNSVNYRGKSYPVRHWADVMSLNEGSSAGVEAVYEKDFYAGTPAISCRKSGKGKAVYFGVAGCDELTGAYLDSLLGEYGIKTARLPEKVFITRRKGKEADYTFIINMGNKDQEFKYDISGNDIISGSKINETIALKAYQIMIIENSPNNN